MFLHVDVPKNKMVIYVKEKTTKMKGEINKAIIIVEDFNIPLSIFHRTTRESISKNIELNNINR